MPQLDVLGGKGLDISGGVDDARPGRACADIDADEVVLGE